MLKENIFIPFHYYDLGSIEESVEVHNLQLIASGNPIVGEHLLVLKDKEDNLLFSFVATDKNDDGIFYMCVFNKEPLTTHEYRIIRTINDDFLVHVNHQYSHFTGSKDFIGKLPYHLYQLAKNTIDREQIVIAHSTLDALKAYEASASVMEED